MIKLSCCQWGLDEGTGPLRYWRRVRRTRIPETRSLPTLAKLGFRSVDVCPTMQTTPTAKSALENLGLEVCCLSLSHEAPPNSSFDSDDDDEVEPVEKHTHQAIEHAAKLGADFAYLVPPKPKNLDTLPILSENYRQIAGYGQGKGIKIAIEHFPGTVLPTVKATLEFIEKLDHPNLYLLLDIGHAQMSEENPADVLPLAGDRLAYIHLDDNDGKNDLHLALTDGVQTKESLSTFFSVTRDIGYTGPFSLEMHPALANPLDAIRHSKAIAEDCW